MKHFLVPLALLALLSRPASAGDADQRSAGQSGSGPRSQGQVIGAAAAASVAKSTISLGPNLILGLFVGSALLSFTFRLLLRGHDRRAGNSPPVPDPADRPGSVPSDPLGRSEHLMSPAELDLVSVLGPLVSPVCRISIKVRIADLFEIRPGHQAAYSLISNKHIGFILTEHETGRIVCGIELDAPPSRQPGSVEYDAFVDRLFASQQLPLLRLPCARCYDAGALRRELAGIIGKAHAG